MPREQVRIATRANEDWLLEGQTFEKCDIIGPAVLFNISHVTYQHCSVEGKIEEVFWTSTQGKVRGIMGVKNCVFRRCDLRGIGWVGSREDMARARREWSSEASRRCTVAHPVKGSPRGRA